MDGRYVSTAASPTATVLRHLEIFLVSRGARAVSNGLAVPHEGLRHHKAADCPGMPYLTSGDGRSERLGVWGKVDEVEVEDGTIGDKE